MMVRFLGGLLLAIAVVSALAPNADAGYCSDPADLCGTAYQNCSVYTCLPHFWSDTCACAKYGEARKCSCY